MRLALSVMRHAPCVKIEESKAHGAKSIALREEKSGFSRALVFTLCAMPYALCVKRTAHNAQ